MSSTAWGTGSIISDGIRPRFVMVWVDVIALLLCLTYSLLADPIPRSIALYFGGDIFRRFMPRMRIYSDYILGDIRCIYIYIYIHMHMYMCVYIYI